MSQTGAGEAAPSRGWWSFDSNPLKQRANRFHDRVEIGEVAGLALRKDPLSIDADLEDAAARRDELHRTEALFEFEKFDRQTDGFRLVISSGTIFDRQFRFHRGKNLVRPGNAVERFPVSDFPFKERRPCVTRQQSCANLRSMSAALHQRVASLLPPERWLVQPEQLAAYESDGLTAFRTTPLGVALPETAEEVIELVRFCRAERLPFVARGSGTSLSGGSLPVAGGIVIALNRLNRILRLDPAQRIAVVEPGVINTQVTLAAAAHQLHYAPDPSSQSICTIGGNVAFNSGGAHCLKYGMTSNHVLGIKAVLATGEVVQWGGPSRENVGPDWCGLFTGNEGLFGIALEITLQLLPRAEAFHTVLAGYRTLEEAGDAVSAIVASGLLPGAMEIMDALALEAATAAVHAEYPPGCEAVLIVELEGPREIVSADRERLDQIIAASRPVEARPARDGDERIAIWKGRKSAFSAVGRLSP